MTWHDELRKLDEGLAAGLISAEEYRARRDELLSAAAGAGGSPSFTPPGAPQSVDSTQVMQPIRDNTPPPGNAEATQVVSGNSGAEATQVVRGWQPQQPAGDADRTQVVPGPGAPQGFPPPPQQQHPGFPASPPSGFPPPPFPPQHQQQPPHQHQQQPPQNPWGDETSAAPPWGGAGDLPPLPAAGNEAWIRQGPEVFGASSGKSSKLWPIIGIVVAVALIGAGVWFFGFSGNGSSPDNTATSAQPTPTTTTPQKPLELLPPGPGTPDPKSGVKSIDQLRTDELLAAGEIAVIGSANPAEITYKGSTEKEFQYSAFVIETKDAAAAQDLQKKLVEFGRSDNMVNGEVGELPKNGTILQFIDDSRAMYRIIWVSGNKVVRTNVSQNPSPPQGPNRDSALVREFHRLTVGVAAKFPGQ